MGIDWNGDGKHDWKDDAFFHSVINSDSSKDESSQVGSSKNRNTRPQKQTVSKWEKGEAMPAIDILKNLADFYCVSLDYLTEEEHAEQTPVEQKEKRQDLRLLSFAVRRSGKQRILKKAP